MSEKEQVINEWIMNHTDTAMAMAYLFFILMIIDMVYYTYDLQNLHIKKEKNKKGGMQL